MRKYFSIAQYISEIWLLFLFFIGPYKAACATAEIPKSKYETTDYIWEIEYTNPFTCDPYSFNISLGKTKPTKTAKIWYINIDILFHFNLLFI